MCVSVSWKRHIFILNIQKSVNKSKCKEGTIFRINSCLVMIICWIIDNTYLVWEKFLKASSSYTQEYIINTLLRTRGIIRREGGNKIAVNCRNKRNIKLSFSILVTRSALFCDLVTLSRVCVISLFSRPPILCHHFHRHKIGKSLPCLTCIRLINIVLEFFKYLQQQFYFYFFISFMLETFLNILFYSFLIPFSLLLNFISILFMGFLSWTLSTSFRSFFVF